jgi:hypothetical protein
MLRYACLSIVSFMLGLVSLPGCAQTEELQHVHNSGWGLHSATLTIAPSGLLIRTQSSFRDSNGNLSDCSLPTLIPFNQVLVAEVREYGRGPLAGFKSSSGQVAQLHLEVRDDRGRKSTYNFVSRTAIHDNLNKWHEGQDDGSQVKGLAQALQAAMALGVGKKQTALDTDVQRPYHANETRSGSAGSSRPSSGYGGGRVEQDVAPPLSYPTAASENVHYDIQLSGSDHLDKVTVRPASTLDPSDLLISWPDSRGTKVVRLENISKVEVKERTLQFGNADSRTPLQFGIGVPKKPKLHELIVEFREHDNKRLTYHFVSDTATCKGETPCQEGTDGGQRVRDLSAAIHRAIADRTAALKQVADESAKQQARPSGLVSGDVKYDDSHSLLPNSRIDAGEKAELVITVDNHGPGTAYHVAVTASSDKRSVVINGGQNLGDIPPGQKREARLSIVADLDLTDGNVTLGIDAHEQRGYDAHRVNVIIPTAGLKPPDLSIERSGNSQPANGETFEFVTLVRNSGAGPAVGVVLSASGLPAGIEPTLLTTRIGAIQPGQTQQGKLAFAIPRNWSGKSVYVEVKAIDGRGDKVALGSRTFNFDVFSRKPILSSSIRVLMRGLETTELANDQSAEIEVTPQNEGELDAVDVSFRLSSPGVTFQRAQIEVGTIRPHEKHLPQRIGFSVPRAFAKDRLPILVELSQRDFPSASVVREFVVRRRLPDLRPRWTILGTANSRTIEQNQTVTLELDLDNNGNLSAKEVVARIGINNSVVTPQSPLEVGLGTIEPKGSARATFSLHISRSVPVGQLPIQVFISQADFPASNEAASFEVRTEPTREVRITPSPETSTSPGRRTPPTVVWVSPRNGVHVRDSVIEVVGVVSSNRHTSRLEIAVNGKAQPADDVGQHWNVTGKGEGPEVSDVAISIPLDFGENKIQLTAYDDANESGAASITVSRDKSASMEDLETQRVQVVRIRSHPADRAAETAAGTYVGKDQANAYFVTAFHPLAKGANGSDPVETVELQFYSSPTSFEAKVLNHYNPDADTDLAVVFIPADRLPAETTRMTLKNAAAELPIHIIGHPASERDWTSWAGMVQNELAVSGKGQLFSTGTDPSLTEGFSGGPVFDSKGDFIGMHLAGSKGYTKNLKSEAILAALRAWHVPTTNLE